MHFIRAAFLLVCVLNYSAAAVDLARVNALEQAGNFRAAAQELNQALANQSLTVATRQELRFELDRLERIRKDYPFTRKQLFARLQEAVRGLTEAEFTAWVTEGRFDRRAIDGEERFMGSSVSNLFFRYPELNARRQPPRNTAAHDRANWEVCVAIKQAARAAQKPYVLPKRFQAVMTVTVKPDVVPAGEVVRAWLPIPREFPFQTDFKLMGSSAPIRKLAEAHSPIRSAYLERPAQAGAPTVFQIEYEYTAFGVCFDLKPEEARRPKSEDAAMKPFLAEAPHVLFTPKLRELSARIIGAETNPAVIAKRCYDWIAANIKYSYALEYSTIRNISDYCLSNGYGDCGQEALLFIALCRLNGIPARWQSGWDLFPGAKTIHDWCEIYLEPYGWVPVDPYKGIWAMRYAPSLTPEQQREARDFYFGGLDFYRLAANSDHNQALVPPKNSFRSDPVDFQRGELEWGTNNIYFDQYKYDLKIEELSAP